MTSVTFTEFRKNASALLSSVEKGKTLLILRHGKAVAQVSPVTPERAGEPSWKAPGLRLSVPGASLSKAVLAERETP